MQPATSAIAVKYAIAVNLHVMPVRNVMRLVISVILASGAIPVSFTVGYDYSLTGVPLK